MGSTSVVLLSLAFLIGIAGPSFVSALSSAEQNAILACHNNYRSSLAKGTAQNVTGNLPAGKNIRQLSYNASIEAIAQKWADQCTMSHSSSSSRPGLGENLYMSSSSTVTNTAALNSSCNAWWAEFKQYGIQASLVLDTAQFNKGIGHATQMGWANTAQIGCARANCPNSTWKTYVVCNYGPAGNYLNQVVYQHGTTCSGCSAGTSCKTNGLCAA